MTTNAVINNFWMGAPRVLDEDPLIDETIGTYRIEEKIGEGAMCRVYRALDLVRGARVAIKLQKLHSAKGTNHAERLRREAAVAMRLRHPNVVRALGYGTSPEHGPYLIMELIEGRTLETELSLRGTLPPKRAAMILRGAASGLSAAHRFGYIHRDLKPGNLMLGAGDEVKILDFGIVGFAPEVAPSLRLTQENQVIGTPSYMSPEQLADAKVTPASDLYSLGAILFLMLTGEPPFTGTLQEVIARHYFAPPPALPSHAGLGSLALWLLEKSPVDRPESAEHVVARVDSILAALAS